MCMKVLAQISAFKPPAVLCSLPGAVSGFAVTPALGLYVSLALPFSKRDGLLLKSCLGKTMLASSWSYNLVL